MAARLGESDSWLLELRTDDGRLSLRQTVRDPMILSGRSRIVDLALQSFITGPPTTLLIRAQPGTDQAPITVPVSESFWRRHGELVRWALSRQIPERTISFEPIGGLANQLYQAGAMLGYARRYDIPWVCQLWRTTSPSMIAPRPTYWDSVMSELVRLSEGRRQDPGTMRNYGDPTFTYTEIPQRHDHQILWGHFLSYKYFHEVRTELLELLWGGRGIETGAATAMERLHTSLPRRQSPLVSVHVRRGDSLRNTTLTRMNMGYYHEAMAMFPGAVFAVFSDDIPWCRRHFTGDDVVFVEGNSDTVDLFLMASCDHHVIANSTYSWWAAYLNRHTTPKVIYPTPWFRGEKRRRDMSDFFLPDWQEHPVVEP